MNNVSNRILGLIFDPIVFLSMLGPLFLSVSFEFMDGSLALNLPKYHEEGSKLKSLLDHEYKNGLVSYIIAYYTLIASAILWVARCYRANLISDYMTQIGVACRKIVTPTFLNRDSARLRYSGTVFVLLFIALCLLSFTQYIGSPDIQLVYVRHANAPEDTWWQSVVKFLPPFNSVITWCRGLIAVHVVYLIRPFEA